MEALSYRKWAVVLMMEVMKNSRGQFIPNCPAPPQAALQTPVQPLRLDQAHPGLSRGGLNVLPPAQESF